MKHTVDPGARSFDASRVGHVAQGALERRALQLVKLAALTVNHAHAATHAGQPFD